MNGSKNGSKDAALVAWQNAMPLDATANTSTTNSTFSRLRDYQEAAVERLREALRNGRKRPVFQLPTGGGKTRIASRIVNLAREKGRRVTFCVPAIALIDQTREAFYNDGLTDIGVIQAKHHATDPTRPIQIASVQTLARREFPETDLVIIDECHRVFNRYWEWMKAKPDLPFIGLSATPWTKGLGKHFDDLIISATTAELIEAGHLCRFRVFAPSHPDLQGVKIVAGGDYHEGQLSQVMSKSPLVADVVDTWVTRAENRPTLVFAVDRAHAKHLQERFLQLGINAAYQDMATPDHTRRDIKRGFHEGRFPVVCNVGTLTTGVDWDVRCIVLARPTRSEILFVQIIGRGLRPKPGEPSDCLILDHSDTTLRLGFVTDIHHAALDDGRGAGKQERKAPLPKECPKCAFLVPPRTNPCPNCGHRKEAPRNQVEHTDGELVELERRSTPKPGHLPLPKVQNGCVRIRGQRIPLPEFYAELKGHQEARGYAPKWVVANYREATGEWPPRSWAEWVEASEPSPVVAGWIKHRLIKFARSRRSTA